MASISRDALVAELDALLDVEAFSDYCPNGLQVEGKTRIRKVATAVTASLAAIELAAEAKADALIVHHGIFWNHQTPLLRGSHLKRVKALLKAKLNLLAYHLPLDHHAEVGNNAPALRDLGVGELVPFAKSRGSYVGWRGVVEGGVAFEDFLSRCEDYYQTKALAFRGGAQRVQRVGIVSGAGQGELETAVREGLDVFLTGEVSEYNFHLAMEEGIHHLSLGHHATERVGPRKLLAHLQERHGLDGVFLDVPNPA